MDQSNDETEDDRESALRYRQSVVEEGIVSFLKDDTISIHLHRARTLLCPHVVIGHNPNPRSEVCIVQVLREEIEKVDADTGDLG